MHRHQWRLSPEQQVNLMNYLSDFPMLKAVYEIKQKPMEFILLKTLASQRTREQLPRYFKLLDQLKKPITHLS